MRSPLSAACELVRSELAVGVVLLGLAVECSVQTLLGQLRDADEPVHHVCFENGLVSQAAEQNWRILNRHKATLQHTGPRMYVFLLHRVAHLLNLRKWPRALP